MNDVLNNVSKIAKQLMLKEPFYGMFLSTLNKCIRTDVPTAGVSKLNVNYQLAINEEFWNSLDSDFKKIGLLKHELLHICFHHLIERDEFPDHELHNIAADVEINQYIDPVYYPSNDLLLPSTFPELNLPLKAGTREYYKLLQQAKKDGTSPSLNAMLDGNPSSGGTHGNASDLHPTWKEFDEMSEADKRLAKAQIDHQIKELIDAQDRSRGLIPSELESYINGLGTTFLTDLRVGDDLIIDGTEVTVTQILSNTRFRIGFDFTHNLGTSTTFYKKKKIRSKIPIK